MLLPLTFFFCGAMLLPWPGLQNDEALFARAVYGVGGTAYHVSVLKHQIPIMFLTYLGALKSWLLWPVLMIFGSNVWSVRIPALAGGAITVWLCFLLLHRIHGRRAAWVGAALLATDTSFVLTTCFDWGPVMLQHLLITAALLLGVQFYREQKNSFLAGCFFCAGLALWDKALALWLLSGIAIALLVLFFGELRQVFSLRRAGIAAGSLAAGAFPLLVYNLRHGFITFRSNAHLDFSEIAHKIHIMRITINGSALFGYVVNWPSAPSPRAAASGFALAASRIHGMFGDRLTNWMFPLWIVAGLLALWLLFTPVRRILLFAAIAFTIGWAQMVVTKAAGGSSHHTILLWPLPEIFIAVVLAEASRRIGRAGIALLTAAAAVLVVVNLLNLNQYVYQFARFGAATFWTDAMDDLPRELRATHAPSLCIIDWGLYDNLLAETRGRLPVLFAAGPFADPVITDGDRQEAIELLSKPGTLFISHTDDKQIFAGVNQHLDQIAHDAGFHKSSVITWSDGNGRPVYEGLAYSH